MNNKSELIRSFADCIPVKGYLRGIIYDLSRNDFDYIPNDLTHILVRHQGKSVNQIKKVLNLPTDTIDEYLDFLIGNDYIFFCDEDELELFPEVDLTWDYPSLISNLIIDDVFEYKFLNFDFFINIGIKHIVARFSSNVDIEKLKVFLQQLNVTDIITIELILQYNENSSQIAEELISNYFKIRTISFYNSNQKSIKKGENYMGNIVFTTKNKEQVFSNHTESAPTLNVNIQLFSEGQKHNTYFNRKLYIGSNGEIKNAPECQNEFGYIQNLNSFKELIDIISKPQFQKYWFVSPDMIDVTKDSEFRYMCVDNRIPYQRKDGSWYYKDEPEYNPYICKWKGEEGYLTLKECGVVSDENGFYIDHEKIANINKKLWGE